MVKKFHSQADEIRYYVKQLLNDDEEYAVKVIKDFVEEKSGKQFSDGAYAGSLRDLIKKEPEYINPRRGIYKYQDPKMQATKYQNHLEEGAVNILKDTLNALYEHVDQLNPLTISEHQQKVLNSLKDTVDFLKNTINELEEQQN